jgi:hypothetical protein
MANLILNGSTSGSVTLSSPAVSGTTTLTLPTTSGTIVTTGTPQSGSVLQVVNANNGTLTSNSTTTYADTGLAATITPKFATSTILVIATVNGLEKSTANVNNSIALRLVRGATTISTFMRYANWTNSTTALVTPSGVVNYLDSPATTSATTYKIQFANENNGASATVNSSGSISFITLMEIAA